MNDELDDPDDLLCPRSSAAECGQPAIFHVTNVDQGTGEAESFSLCAGHAREHFPDEHIPDENSGCKPSP